MTNKQRVLLCILDGLGINPENTGNAFTQADTPCLDRLLADRPHTKLITHGEAVGLPAGQMGNSEVGHLSIGAGRLIEQWLLKISRGLAKDSDYLDHSCAYQNFISDLNAGSKPVHLLGLFSNGGVHSHVDHLYALIKRLLMDTQSDIFLHVITDGRDTAPDQSLNLLAQFEQDFHYATTRVKIASVSGRYYAMDRDSRWERTDLALAALTSQNSEKISAADYVRAQYKENLTDEFILPKNLGTTEITADSAVISFNFRADRMRQIVGALTTSLYQKELQHQFIIEPKKFLCFTSYDSRLAHLPFLFAEQEIKNYLGQAVEAAGLTQVRIAETEKYPHVTYFFNGLNDEVSAHETRVMLQSPKDVATYDLKPEMSAKGVTNAILEALSSQEVSLIVANYANCDMVGHTGSLAAAIKAVETVDQQVAKILPLATAQGFSVLILADHGNAEQMIKADGSVHTAHTTFLVPAILVAPDKELGLRQDKDLSLINVAGTVLELLGVQKPEEMTGASLLTQKN